MSESTFVISDIHGCYREFKQLLEKLPLTPESTVVILGDYVDRGENAKGVVDTILELRQTCNVIALKGNHEEMFLHFIEGRVSNMAATFVFNGGGATLASYGDDCGNYEVPKDHLDFFKQLDYMHISDEYVFVHAGLPNVPLDQIDVASYERQLLWIRREFFNSNFNWGKTVVHGHTPVEECYISDRRINVDTGCVYGGALTALELPYYNTYSVDKLEPTKHIYLRDANSIRKSVRFDTNIPVRIYFEEHTLLFDTINYSEFGMYISDVKYPEFNRLILEAGQEIKGDLGEFIFDPAPFVATVIRHEDKNGTSFYALEFVKTPFECIMAAKNTNVLDFPFF